MCKVNVGILYFTPALTAGVLSEYLPRLGIQTTDLPRFYPLGHRVGMVCVRMGVVVSEGRE